MDGFARNHGMARSLRMAILTIVLLAVTASCDSRFPTLERESSWADGSLSIYYFDADTRRTLKTIDLDGTDDKTILGFPIDEYELSASGTQIAFSDYRRRLCGVVDLVSGKELWIPFLCTGFELSPDGLSIAYVSTPFDQRPQDLRIFSVATTDSRLVAQTTGPPVGPRWSADGRRLLYSDLFTKKHYSASLDGGEVVEEGEHDDISEFWRSRVGLNGMHFSQWDSAGIGWYRAVSPTGDYVAECKEGSLVVVDQRSGEARILLKNTGWFSPDIGVLGFSKPIWTRDERYVVGVIRRSIVVVEVETGRSGIVTQGTHALAYIPGYRPGRWVGGQMYDSAVKMSQ